MFTTRGDEKETSSVVTYEKWLAVGVGQIGMSVDEFEAMSPAQFIMAWAGYASREARREKSEWERTRTATAMIVNVQIEEKHRLSPTMLWPLPWDVPEKRETETITIEERRERAAALIAAAG